MNILQMLKYSINTIYVRYIQEENIDSLPIYYIGGSQILPPPLSQEEEEEDLVKDSLTKSLSLTLDKATTKTKREEEMMRKALLPLLLDL